MLANLNKQLYAAQAALKESQDIYPDCLVLKVTLNAEVVA